MSTIVDAQKTEPALFTEWLPPPRSVYRLSVEQYEAMVDSGLFNLVDRQVEVYTEPGPHGYRSSVFFRPGQFVPVMIDGSEVGRILVDDMLPRLSRSSLSTSLTWSSHLQFDSCAF